MWWQLCSLYCVLSVYSLGDLHQFLKSSHSLRLPTEPQWSPQSGTSGPPQCPQSGPSGPPQCPQSGPSDPLQYPQSGPHCPLQTPQIGPTPKPLREDDALDHFGMTAKKSHEVTRMADMVHRLARSKGAQQVGGGEELCHFKLYVYYHACVCSTIFCVPATVSSL